MAAAFARWAIALVAAGLMVLAGLGLIYAYRLLTLEGDEGGATVFGVFALLLALVVGLVGIGLFAVTRR